MLQALREYQSDTFDDWRDLLEEQERRTRDELDASKVLPKLLMFFVNQHRSHAESHTESHAETMLCCCFILCCVWFGKVTLYLSAGRFHHRASLNWSSQ